MTKINRCGLISRHIKDDLLTVNSLYVSLLVSYLFPLQLYYSANHTNSQVNLKINFGILHNIFILQYEHILIK